MDKHEKTCSSETKMKFKEVEYGSQCPVRKTLEEDGILSVDFEIPYVTYDIETIPCLEKYNDDVITIQKPITIAYWDGESGDVFYGENMVEKFLIRMKEIQVSLNIISMLTYFDYFLSYI